VEPKIDASPRPAPQRTAFTALLLFIRVSIGWGVMFATDSTRQWKAGALSVVHGLAGVIWMPASKY
jgi:hypothetical protein